MNCYQKPKMYFYNEEFILFPQRNILSIHAFKRNLIKAKKKKNPFRSLLSQYILFEVHIETGMSQPTCGHKYILPLASLPRFPLICNPSFGKRKKKGCPSYAVIQRKSSKWQEVLATLSLFNLWPKVLGQHRTSLATKTIPCTEQKLLQ